MEASPAPAGEREHPLARLGRKQDIMGGTRRAVTLITVAIAVLAPAATITAAAAWAYCRGGMGACRAEHCPGGDRGYQGHGHDPGGPRPARGCG